jgi:hypothetical protein
VKRLLTQLDGPDRSHSLLSLFLLRQQLLLTRNVASAHCLPVLYKHVLAVGRDTLSSKDLDADRSLNNDLKLLSIDRVFQSLAHSTALRRCFVAVSHERECIDWLAIQEYIHFNNCKK